jgi:Flp pilus assembly protein TadD
MRSVSYRTFLGVVLASALGIQTASSQQPAPAPAPQQPQQPAPQQPTSPAPTQPGTQPGTIPGRDPNQGRFPQDNRSQFPDIQQQRVFMFSGKVMLDDGTPPPEPVVIERVCGGMPRPEAYTDSKGRFSFQLGQNQHMMMDASVGSSDPFGSSIGQRTGVPGGGSNISERDLMNCELRAALPGFRSDVVSLAGRRSLDNPDVGTLVLHRLAKVDGFTFSGTSLYAPKDSKKAFEKGQKAAKKKKWDEAERELLKATSAYSQYAVAWYELGMTYQQQSKLEEAKNAYAAAVKADAKYISPYAQLARIAAAEKKWDESAEHSGKVIKLNPYYSPDIYFISGLANLNANKLDAAEEHAREGLKMDAGHRNPKIAHLLGVILAQKQDYAGAAENMRAYLKYAPQAADAENVKRQLSEVEKRLNARTPGAVNAQQ